MDKKTFIVIALAGGKPIIAPAIIMADDHDEAINLMGIDIAAKLPSLPFGTVIHCFDIDTEVTYLGMPNPEQKPPEEECDEEREPDITCTCPNRLGCEYLVNGDCRLKADELPGSEFNTAHGKLCADLSERVNPELDDGDVLYKAGDLLFAIGPYAEAGDEMRAEGYKFVVNFTTKECWAKNKCQSYDLGGHNIDQAALQKAGIAEAELMESIFEVLPYPDDTVEKLAGRLIDAGFGYLQEFQKFIDNCSKEEE